MKKAVIYILIVLAVVGSGTFIMVKNTKKGNESQTTKKKENSNKSCEPIIGGSFALNFETDSDQKIESMDICIACSPDSYSDLPIPVKEGYEFAGWYYDQNLQNKVNATNTLDITPIPKKEKECTIGYEDITIYANWNKKEELKEESKVEETSTIIPEVLIDDDSQSSTVEESPEPSTVEESPEPTFSKIFRKPVEVGKLMREKEGSPMFVFVTKNSSPVYSITNGVVYKVFSNTTSSAGEPVFNVLIMAKSDNITYFIEYLWVKTPKVSLNQIVTSDTVIGNVPIMAAQYLPFIYVNIYSCNNDERNCSDQELIRTYYRKLRLINPMTCMDIPSTNEIWESR